MPYIENYSRIKYDSILDSLAYHLNDSPNLVGDLNYCITRILTKQLDTKHYEDYNAAIGVLECAKLEFYRRRVAVHEDKAIERNGDVE
jgi:hypothetical protein